MLKRILVPVDFSQYSSTAAQYAIELAAKFDASVDVVHVWSPPQYLGPEVMVQIPGETGESLSEYVKEHARRQLVDFVEGISRPADMELSWLLDGGDPRLSILRLAEERQYDLIVMGTHGRTGLSRLFLGSVAEYIVRRAPCPVLTIRLPGGSQDPE